MAVYNKYVSLILVPMSCLDSQLGRKLGHTIVSYYFIIFIYTREWDFTVVAHKRFIILLSDVVSR